MNWHGNGKFLGDVGPRGGGVRRSLPAALPDGCGRGGVVLLGYLATLVLTATRALERVGDGPAPLDGIAG